MILQTTNWGSHETKSVDQAVNRFIRQGDQGMIQQSHLIRNPLTVVIQPLKAVNR
ncbi:MAG: hypothetical protein AB2693_31235 [Candidatus Thiodiazotropha sp.]